MKKLREFLKNERLIIFLRLMTIISVVILIMLVVFYMILSRNKEEIEQIGSVIRDIFKGMDICGRFGGDEFLVLMKNVNSRDNVVTLGEKLRSALKERVKDEVYAKDVSLSIGSALFPDHGKTFLEILGSADKALYYVKDHGRDGLCIYDP